MGFKKLAIAAAVAAAPMSALALEPMQDEALSAVTGQDGISIGLSTNLSLGINIHDTDGFTDTSGNAYTDSGAIVIDNFGLSNGAGGNALIDIDIDAGTNAGVTPTLNVQVTLGDATNDTEIDLGELKVANSNRTAASAADADWGTTATTATILDLGSLTLGGNTALNIQLGNEAQGHMILLDTSITDGISLSGFAINDAGGAISGGGIGGSLAIVDNGGTNLNLDVGIDANASGLVVSLNEFGDATNGADVRIVDAYLGSATGIIGDVEITGLNLNGTQLTITGK